MTESEEDIKLDIEYNEKSSKLIREMKKAISPCFLEEKNKTIKCASLFIMAISYALSIGVSPENIRGIFEIIFKEEEEFFEKNKENFDQIKEILKNMVEK